MAYLFIFLGKLPDENLLRQPNRNTKIFFQKKKYFGSIIDILQNQIKCKKLTINILK